VNRVKERQTHVGGVDGIVVAYYYTGACKSHVTESNLFTTCYVLQNDFHKLKLMMYLT